MEISLSVDETNKLRAQLGLRPLVVSQPPADGASASAPGSDALAPGTAALSGQSALSVEDTNKLRKSLGLKPIAAVEPAAAQEARNFARLEHERLQAQKDQALKARIHDAKVKKPPRKTLLETYDQESTDDWLDKLAAPAKPSEKKAPKTNDPVTVSGVKIAHGEHLDGVQDDDIFTFEDGRVLEDADDVLVNERLRAKAKVDRDLKEKAKVDDIKRNIFYRPQESEEPAEVQGEVRDGNIVVQAPAEVTSPDKTALLQDLFDETPKPKTKMKTLKKKKTKTKRTLVDDDIELRSVALAPIEAAEDDDLESVLSQQRKRKQLQRAHMTPEELAREVKRVARQRQEEELESRGMVGDDITFDPTAEFLSSLKAPILQQEKEVKQEIKEEQGVKEELEDELKEGLNESASEPTFSTGIASTLKFLKAKDIIRDTAGSRAAREAQKQSELLKLQVSIEERIARERLENDKQFVALPKQEQAQILAREVDAILRQKNLVNIDTSDYNPEVKLTYRDEKGRTLDTKQAFKFMSHKFHGTKKKN